MLRPNRPKGPVARWLCRLKRLLFEASTLGLPPIRQVGIVANAVLPYGDWICLVKKKS